ncbi:c-type cytochrome biogenesis protein CcmI [Methylocapsa acidiphila]|uniref:c-type cytochrome biogenesis protein CcmI n=1 Tax=Methylocapsa acidiphila TaxID=133552 RepID=UPI00042207B6|nr:c-type cytochrome biogenesis protein CcmI [Methylocapsa acidiphila]
MLWLIFALLTGSAALSILWPLIKTPRGLSQGATEVALYKAQIAEIDRDAAQGLIAADDVESVKADAARRLMATETPARTPPKGRGSIGRFAVPAAAFAAPALAIGLYWMIGSPTLPDLPLEARRAASPERNELMAAVAKIEAHLAQHPDDGRAYEVLAPVYLSMGRASEAVRAYSESLRLLGETPERLAAYGEARVFAANGAVDSEARQAFETASAKMPSLAKPRFFLGLAAEQDGDAASARRIWSALLAEAPADAPWARVLRERVAALPDGASPAGADAETQAGPRASPGLAAKIEAMPETERAGAIRGMVERLATRLAQNGQDLDGWLRLVRAYAVLNESDKARAAVSDAKRNLAADETAIGRIDALARELGLEG